MKKIFDKYPILKYVVTSYIKYVLIIGVLVAVMFALLYVTGIYTRLESILDLKYNSPFVLIPLYGFAILGVICFVVGGLLYFHKYKRTKINSIFYRKISIILNEKKNKN